MSVVFHLSSFTFIYEALKKVSMFLDKHCILNYVLSMMIEEYNVMLFYGGVVV